MSRDFSEAVRLPREQDCGWPASRPGLCLTFFFFNRKTNTCVTWGQVESLSLYYIYFLQLGFPVYRLVLGSSKRAKEEIGIAELRAAQRPSVQER